MRFITFYIFLFSVSSLFSENIMQETATAPSRTPEQEANMQTQRITEELNLSEKQAKAVYEINLRHARERQISNSRTEALKRSRVKNEAMQKVLTPEQYDKLQERRINRNPNTSFPQRTYPNTPTAPTMRRRTAPVNSEQIPARKSSNRNASSETSSSQINQRRQSETTPRVQPRVQPNVQPQRTPPQRQESSTNRPPVRR